MSAKSISLIMPAYKQEKTIAKDIKSIDNILKKIAPSYEIIVVSDGCDSTHKAASKIENPNLKVFAYTKNAGKGYAVKFGVSKAKKEIIGFIDSGMDIDPNEISLMIDIMEWNNADIIIGSKLHAESKVNYPLSRRILSWGYRAYTGLLFGLSVKDTQVGLKFFKRNVAKKIFPKILVKRFAFDIEVLAIAYNFGYKKILEAPIKLNFKANTITSLNFWRIIFWMLWDTTAVFYRLKILHYYTR